MRVIILLLLSTGCIAGEFNITILCDGFMEFEQDICEYEVDQMVEHVNLTPPFDEHEIIFELYEVISNESGVTHDPRGVIRDTALSAKYYARDNKPNAMGADKQKAFSYSNNEITVVVVPSYKHGGSTITSNVTDRVLVVIPLNANILLHELGHAIAGLNHLDGTVMGNGYGFNEEQQERIISAINEEKVQASGGSTKPVTLLILLLLKAARSMSGRSRSSLLHSFRMFN